MNQKQRKRCHHHQKSHLQHPQEEVTLEAEEVTLEEEEDTEVHQIDPMEAEEEAIFTLIMG
jgi:hypothetical protein